MDRLTVTAVQYLTEISNSDTEESHLLSELHLHAGVVAGRDASGVSEEVIEELRKAPVNRSHLRLLAVEAAQLAERLHLICEALDAD